MRQISRTIIRSVAILAIPASLSAQVSLGDIAAYTALIGSPSAGLSQNVSPLMAGVAQSKWAVSARYGRMSADGAAMNNFGLTGSLPLNEMAIVSFTAGMRNNSVDGGESSSDVMLGIGGDMALGQRNVGESAKFVFGANADIGYSKADAATLLSGRIGVPLSLAFSTGGTAKIVPFVAPGFGFGRISEAGQSESGTRFQLGAGVGVHQLSERLSLNFGMQKVFIDGGRTLFGFGVSFQ